MKAKVFDGKNIGERIDGTDGPDKIYGNGGNDFLVGHHGEDLVSGGAGKDTIYGGQDHDQLIGGSKADSFMFNITTADDSDTIADFKHKTDKIGFDSRVYLDLHTGKLSADDFYLGTKAHDSDDHVIYNSKTGDLFYDADGKGGESQFLLAHLDNHAKLSVTDFFVF